MRMLKDAEALVVVWGVTLLALPLLAAFAFVLAPQWPQVDGLFILSVVGAGGLNVAAHFASAKALKLEEASLVTPLLIFSPVFTLLISALFLEEMPSAKGVVG